MSNRKTAPIPPVPGVPTPEQKEFALLKRTNEYLVALASLYQKRENLMVQYANVTQEILDLETKRRLQGV